MFPKLYVDAWRRVRAEHKQRPLADDLLWHKVYDEYINSLPLAELGASRDELIEKHLRIVGPIAGQIAWRRTPHSFGIWAKECQPNLSHVGLVHELTAMGNLVLFIAADRYNPETGAFSTYANYWIKKFVRLYLEELVSVVPPGDPDRRVMDIFDAAIARRRLYRGKAKGGVAIFDASITIPGPEPDDKEIETAGSDGTRLSIPAWTTSNAGLPSAGTRGMTWGAAASRGLHCRDTKVAKLLLNRRVTTVTNLMPRTR